MVRFVVQRFDLIRRRAICIAPAMIIGNSLAQLKPAQSTMFCIRRVWDDAPQIAKFKGSSESNTDNYLATDLAGYEWLVNPPELLRNSHVRKVSLTPSAPDQTGYPVPVLSFSLTDVGTRVFAELTDRYFGQHLGVFLNEVLVVAPRISVQIRGGVFQISYPGKTQRELEEIADGVPIAQT
jgi:preprotein translocase subunit SecD